MQVSRHELDDVTVIVLDGGLGYDNHKAFKADIEPFLSRDGLKAVIDLERVNYLSSWGIGGLLSLSGQIRKNGGDVAFANLHGDISEVIHMMRLNTVFDLYDSVDEAAQVLRQRAKDKSSKGS